MRLEYTFLRIILELARAGVAGWGSSVSHNQSDVRRLHECAGGYYRGLHGRAGGCWLIVHNEPDQELLALLGDKVRMSAPGRKGERAGAVRGFTANRALAADEALLRSAPLPNGRRPIMGWLMPRVGPRGLEFAWTRVEGKAVETVLPSTRAYPKRLPSGMPAHVWALFRPYDFAATLEAPPIKEG